MRTYKTPSRLANLRPAPVLAPKMVSPCKKARVMRWSGGANCKGYFGRLKIEFFYGCDWSGVTIEEFMGMLDAYLRWYRDIRIKSDLDYRSTMQCRRDLGLAT